MENQQTQMAEEMKTPITAKGRKRYLSYLLAVICVAAFFAHEFLPDTPQSYQIELNKHKEAKKNRTVALNNLKEAGKHTPEYALYLIEKEKTDIAYANALAAKDEIRFLSFQDFQQFVGEFGWALGLFLYSIYNVVIALSRSRESESNGSVILHSVLVFISLYFISWAFFASDFSKTTYVITSVALTSLMILASSKLLKSFELYMMMFGDDRLKAATRSLTDFILFKTPKYIQREDYVDSFQKEASETIKNI